jgi:hypothetical protein
MGARRGGRRPDGCGPAGGVSRAGELLVGPASYLSRFVRRLHPTRSRSARSSSIICRMSSGIGSAAMASKAVCKLCWSQRSNASSSGPSQPAAVPFGRSPDGSRPSGRAPLGRLDLAGIATLSPMIPSQRAGQPLRQVERETCVVNKLPADDRLGSRARSAFTLVRRAPQTRARPRLWHPSPNTREARIRGETGQAESRKAVMERGISSADNAAPRCGDAIHMYRLG